MDIQTVGSFFLISSWVPALLALILHLRTPWTKSEFGRFIAALLFCFFIVLTMSAIRLLFRNSLPEWFEVVRFILYFTLPIVLWWLVILQIRTQRKVKSSDDSGRSSESHS